MSDQNQSEDQKAKRAAAVKTGRFAGGAISSLSALALPALICLAGAGFAWAKISAGDLADLSAPHKSDSEAIGFAKEAVEKSLKLSAGRFDLDSYASAPYFTPDSFERWSQTLSRSGLKQSLQKQAGSMEARVESASIASQGAKNGMYQWRVTGLATVVVKGADGKELSTSRWMVGVDETQSPREIAPKGLAIERVALAPAEPRASETK